MGQTSHINYTFLSQARRDEPSVVLHHAVHQRRLSELVLSIPFAFCACLVSVTQYVPLFRLEKSKEMKLATNSQRPFVLRYWTHTFYQLATGCPKL